MLGRIDDGDLFMIYGASSAETDKSHRNRVLGFPHNSTLGLPHVIQKRPSDSETAFHGRHGTQRAPVVLGRSDRQAPLRRRLQRAFSMIFNFVSASKLAKTAAVKTPFIPPPSRLKILNISASLYCDLEVAHRLAIRRTRHQNL
jgi:hypothetical protein